MTRTELQSFLHAQLDAHGLNLVAVDHALRRLPKQPAEVEDALQQVLLNIVNTQHKIAEKQERIDRLRGRASAADRQVFGALKSPLSKIREDNVRLRQIADGLEKTLNEHFIPRWVKSLRVMTDRRRLGNRVSRKEKSLSATQFLGLPEKKSDEHS